MGGVVVFYGVVGDDGANVWEVVIGDWVVEIFDYPLAYEAEGVGGGAGCHRVWAWVGQSRVWWLSVFGGSEVLCW